MSTFPRVVLLGAGGHSRVLMDCIFLGGAAEVAGVLDADIAREGTLFFGVPVLGTDDLLPMLITLGISHFAVGLGGVGDNAPRRQLYERALDAGLDPLTICHPSAVVSRWAKIGPGCELLPGCIVNSGARLGANVIVNSGAIVEHDCEVGEHAHVATGARLASTVTVGPLAHIGAGATVIQCRKIGAGAIIGAGAVVVRDVEPGAVVAGVPARLLRHGRGSRAE